ncbi:MAG: hypothetical protein IKX71_05050 [Bacteroidales bacterium]|nr:hypothetical protein [Bacteroidales bacterium]
MKFRLLLAALTVAAMFSAGGCAKVDRQNIDSFKKAVPVWAEGRENETNLTLAFRTVIDYRKSADIRIAASTIYRLKVNGEFVGHGPCVAAHDFYRIDCYDIAPFLHEGKNVVSIEVTGYNTESFYLLSQPSFLQAEIISGGRIIAATGRDFRAYDLQQRKQDVPKFSYQRTQMEYWILSEGYDAWQKDPEFSSDSEVALAPQPAKTTIVRRVPYPDYTIHEASILDAGQQLYTFGREYSGFLGCEIDVREKTLLTIDFEELLTEGELKHRMAFRGYVAFELEPGHYTLESIEPYTMQFAQVGFSGDATLERLYLRDYCNSAVGAGQFSCDNEDLNKLFDAARQTIRQCALDIFMDCPSRERAGWLGDSYFSSRVECDLSGETLVEKNFLENYLLPEHFKTIPEGMLPMCYPSDNFEGGTYIPNYAMWFVLQLEEYLARSGDRQMVDAFRGRIYSLVDFFDRYLNSDGLLERLESWVFIEWSAANHFTQDVNYPSNMQYAAMLDAVDRLYGDAALHERAEAMRETIRNQAFDGNFFCDNAKRLPDGTLERTSNHTETCQYYAFFFRTATPETYPELWNKMTTEFGPIRETVDNYPDVPKANALFGNYLRMDLLSENDLGAQSVKELVDFYLPMANQTGTLWENMTAEASCNHGFAAHVAHALYRDAAGLYKVDRESKTVTLRLRDTGLGECHSLLPVNGGNIKLDWTCKDGTFDYDISLPKGWKLIEE